MKRVKLIALVSAVAAAALLFFFLMGLSKAMEVKKTTVATALQDIPLNTVITQEMVTTAEVPDEALLPGVVLNPAEVIGKVNRTEFYAGEQITSTKMVVPGEPGSGVLAYEIKPGMRAITISVDVTSGVANKLKPKDNIDIIGQIVPTTTAATAAAPKTVMLFQNMKILAVDAVMAKSGSASYATLTLEVTPQQALDLTTAVSGAALRAVLRSPADTEKAKVKTVTIKDVVPN